MSVKFVKPPKLQSYAFWISTAIIAFAFMFIMFGEKVLAEWHIWPVSITIFYSLGFILWYLHFQSDEFLRKRFPSLGQTSERILYTLLLNLILLTPGLLLVLFVFDRLHLFGYQINQTDLKYGYVVGFAVNVTAETFWEVIYIIDKYKETTIEKEVLEQLQLQQEFDGLKQKVNPHFLFNCFNTLSSLISEDREKAEKFLDELSKVYRYLLRNNEDGMSTLASEIKFIESYFQLLKTRHGDAVHLQVEVDKRYSNYLLPSLSLQMLIENAVKHNALSKNKPLTIEIFSTTGNRLVVNNNLQRRTVKAPSNRVGLENIQAKYGLLKQRGFQVMENGKNFTVILPLTWNSKEEF